MPLAITSDVFTHGADIPAKYTCQGQDVAPPLRWTGVPQNAKSLVLIVDDPDAPDPQAPRMTWVHWVLYNIPPEAEGLPEAATASDLPAGTDPGSTAAYIRAVLCGDQAVPAPIATQVATVVQAEQQLHRSTA